MDYKLTVWPAVGGASREIVRDASAIRGLNGRGLRLQVTPEGDCREAVFSARGDKIALAPLSAVQVSYLYLGIWVPVFFGEVRRGGNLRDVDGEDYALRGFSRRFEEITLSPGFSTPEQAAHLTVRAIIQDVVNSEQLGTPSLVQYVEALCPDLGFNCREVKDAAQQNPAALLKQIQEDGAKYGVLVRWGIDPQRRFFCRTAKANTRDVTSESPVIRWTQPVAETPCTAVLWYVAKRPDGTWVTHLSRSDDADTYGDRVKALSVDASVPALKNSGINNRTLTGTTTTYTLAQDAALLDDPNGTNYKTETYRSYGASSTASDLTVVYTLAAPTAVLDLEVYIPVAFAQPTDPSKYVEVSSPDGRTVRLLARDYPLQGLIREKLYAGAVMWPAGTTVTLKATPRVEDGYTGNAQVTMYRVRPQQPDATLLDGLAAFHYVSPAQEPADIETTVFVAPTDLPGRIKVTPATGAVYEHPLEAVEYRISGKGLHLGWLAGQADDPNALAQASLIKRRDGQAVITALIAQT